MTNPTPPPAPAFPASSIWLRLDPRVLAPAGWEEFRHREQVEFLHSLARNATIGLELTTVGQSDEGRSLHALRLGNGSRRVLIWARQHGDEPDCTAGLALALHDLVSNAREPHYAFLLEKLDIAILPMVNPDGVALFTRRNALGIDLNRDAAAGDTVEGRIHLKLKDDFRPEVCFNLHDMNPRKSDGAGHLVSLAFQACIPGPDGETNDRNHVYARARSLAGLMADQARVHTPVNIARYTADFMPKAFGDNMAGWGMVSVLIEAGGWYEEKGGDDLVRRLFALCLLRGLHAVAAGEDHTADPAVYDAIPFDSGTKFSDLVIGQARVINGGGRPPCRADVALNINRIVGHEGTRLRESSSIENLGDLDLELAKNRLDLPGHILLPGLVALSPGQHFQSPIPTAHEAEPFLRAGITTLIHGAGPFASARVRDQWIEHAAASTPPLNLISLERISSLRELRARHGLSPLAGLLVQDLEVGAGDLIRLMHFFHPAHPFAVPAGEDRDTVAVDLHLLPAPSPADTRLHLHLSPARTKTNLQLTTADDLRQLAEDFLREPAQITTSIDAAEQPPCWAPEMPGLGGLGDGRVPPPHFLGEILNRSGSGSLSGVVAALNLVYLNFQRAFRLASVGRIEIGRQADLVAVEEGQLAGGAPPETIRPSMVVLNGRVVLRDGNLTGAPMVGRRFLATGAEKF